MADVQNKLVTLNGGFKIGDTDCSLEQLVEITSQIQNQMNNLQQNVLNLIYPVGSIYISINSASPQTFIGGIWERIQDKFLLSAGDTYEAGTIGGSAAIPAHTHSIPELTGTTTSPGSHNHVVTTKTTSYAAGSQPSWQCLSWTGTNADYNTTVYTNGGTIDGSHAHNVKISASTSGSTGTGTDNMPPYLAVYVWKRVS